ADLRAEEPGLLLQAGDVLVQQVGGGRILLVDLVVHRTHRADGRADRLHDHIDRVVGGDLPGREQRQRGVARHDTGAAVRGGVQRPHPLGEDIGALPGDVDDLVEVEVQVAEVRPDDVPVRLLAGQLQVDQVDHHA